jgi:ribonuclease HII
VVASAVFFGIKDKPKIKIICELGDSKKLSSLKREKLFRELLILEKK